MPVSSALTRAAALALALSLASGPAAADATGGPAPAAPQPELKAPLRAEAAFLDAAGVPLDAIAPRQHFRLRVEISSDISPQPPRGLSLFGWLRRVDESALPCGQAAETFLRTGRLPLGTVFLNDPVIGVVTEDRAFVVSDPDFSLASANMLGAQGLETMPGALVADAEGRRFLMALPEAGRVLAVDSAGGVLAGFDGLATVRQVAPSGTDGILALTGAGALIHDDGAGQRRSLAEGITAIRPATRGPFLAALAGNRALVIATGSGRVLADLPAPGLLDAALLHDPASDAPFGVALLRRGQAEIRYLDDPGRPITLALPDTATRIAADPSGRVALAWSPDSPAAQIIDIARGRRVREITAPAPITEIAFSDRSAFLLPASQTHVGALDLQAVARGQDAEFREIQIGTATPAADHPRQLLAPMAPLDGVLAVHADSYQGYRIMDGSVMGDAPAMTATSLRGGLPRLVATLDRSFRETTPDRFETLASLPGAGRFELVATTGLGGLSFCAPLPVSQPEDGRARASGSLSVRPEGEAIRLVVTDAAGRPAAGLAGRVRFSTISGAWRATADLATDGHGVSRLAYLLPDLRGIVIHVENTTGTRIAPFLMEPDTP